MAEAATAGAWDTLPQRGEKMGNPDEACPGCNLTRRALYADGQMGCARCYETFAQEVQRALREIHGATEHIGKT